MLPETFEQLTVQREQLRQLVNLYRPLVEKSRSEEPTEYEIAALGAWLHSYYNGVENIFRRIVLGLAEEMPEGAAWHQRLLLAMVSPTEKRPAVLSEELYERLLRYLQFRHLFRGAYLFQLTWEKMAYLVCEAEEVLEAFEKELDALEAAVIADRGASNAGTATGQPSSSS